MIWKPKFIEQRQEGGTLDAYAAKFLRLSKFAPKLVVEERDRVRRFQQVLSLKIQEHMNMIVMKTYAEVLEAA